MTREQEKKCHVIIHSKSSNDHKDQNQVGLACDLKDQKVVYIVLCFCSHILFHRPQSLVNTGYSNF